jgi:hypothetical protein
VDVEITPEPSDAERRAILAALAAEEREDAGDPSGRAPEPRRDAGVVDPGDPGQN